MTVVRAQLNDGARAAGRSRSLFGSGTAAVLLGTAATLSAAAPMVIYATGIAIQHPETFLDGDQAIDELALIRAGHLAQLVGNYSRFGWDHPGPAWFYALTPVYQALGGHGWAYYVSVLTLQALAASLIVAVVWRWGGLPSAVVAAAATLWFVHVTGEAVFRVQWPPYAPILPMALLFLLAAAGAAGSLPAAAAALVAGSYAVQSHVGTTPTVAGVLAAMAVLHVGSRVLEPRQPAFAGSRHPRLHSALVAAALIVSVAMWVPPLIDEVTGHPGNLTALWQFFVAGAHGRHPYHEAVSALGRLLEVFPFGHPIGVVDDGYYGTLTPARVLVVGGFVIASAGLAAAGALARNRFARSLGALLVVAVPVLVLSLSHVVGGLYGYFLVWMTTLPMVLAIGWAVLLLNLRPGSAGAARAWRLVLVAAGPAAALATMGALIVATVGFERLPAIRDDHFDPDTPAAWGLAETALASEAPQPILIDITQDDRIPIAAGIAVPLTKRGWTVTVNDPWVYIFGSQTRPTGHERLELVLVDPADVERIKGEMPGLLAIGHTSNTYLFVRRLPPGEQPA